MHDVPYIYPLTSQQLSICYTAKTGEKSGLHARLLLRDYNPS